MSSQDFIYQLKDEIEKNGHSYLIAFLKNPSKKKGPIKKNKNSVSVNFLCSIKNKKIARIMAHALEQITEDLK